MFWWSKLRELASKFNAWRDKKSGSSIEGQVFKDKDEKGVDDHDWGKRGVQVNLLDEHHNVIDTTYTNWRGQYKFKGLDAGAYIVQVVAPDHFDFTHQDVGHNDRIDSDVDPHSGKTHVIHVGAREHVRDVDAGLVREEKGSIEGRVFTDEGDKGVNDHDAGKAGVVVNLLDQHHNVIDTTLTDHLGVYEFKNLVKGGYIIEVEAPDHFKFTHQDVGHDDSVDSDIDSETGKTHVFHLDAGEHVGDVDAGLLVDDKLPEPLRVEAEDFTLVTGFVQEGDFIQLPIQESGRAELVTSSVGLEAGVYDIGVDVIDETDGVSQLTLLVDNEEIAVFSLDGGVTNSVNNPLNLRTFTAEDVVIETGDTVTVSLEGVSDGFEFLRIDAVEFSLAEPDIA